MYAIFVSCPALACCEVFAGEPWAKDIIKNLFQSWLMKRRGFVLPGLPPTVREHIASFLVFDVQHLWEDETPAAHV